MNFPNVFIIASNKYRLELGYFFTGDGGPCWGARFIW